MYFIETPPDASWARYDMEDALDAALALALVVARTRSPPQPLRPRRWLAAPRYDGTPGVRNVAPPTDRPPK